MKSIRKTFWFPLVSVLLVAVLVPVQAAGCCKLAALVGLPASLASSSGAAAVPDADMAMTADHSCCPKPAQAAVPENPDAGASAPCPKGDKACCFKGARVQVSDMVSTEGFSPAFSAQVLAWMPEEILPVAVALPALLPPEDGGPPLYLSHLSLLL